MALGCCLREVGGGCLRATVDAVSSVVGGAEVEKRLCVVPRCQRGQRRRVRADSLLLAREETLLRGQERAAAPPEEELGVPGAGDMCCGLREDWGEGWGGEYL